MIKDNSESETKPATTTWATLSDYQQGFFYMHHPTDRIVPFHRQDSTYHGLCYTSRGALAGTRNSSMGPPWRIDPMTHRRMSERSYHGATSRSCPGQRNRYNSLLWMRTLNTLTWPDLTWPDLCAMTYILWYPEGGHDVAHHVDTVLHLLVVLHQHHRVLQYGAQQNQPAVWNRRKELF